MQKIKCLTLFVCLSGTLPALHCLAKEPLRIDIDTTTKVSINGIDQVRDSLFGLDGLEVGNRPQLVAANMYTATGSSALIGGIAEDPKRPGQIDRTKLQSYLDMAQPNSDDLRINHYLHCLQSGPSWQSGPQERNGYVIPQDLDVYAEWAEAVIRHRLKTMPNTEHYFQFFGEISLMGYWNNPELLRDPTRESTNRTGRIGAQRLIDVIAATHHRLHQSGLKEVRLGTPGVTNALQWSNWRTWQSWWEPMVEQLGDKISFYGLHWYDMTPDMLHVEAGIIQNAQQIRWGNRKPICVQESDYTQGPMDDPLNGPYNAYYLWTLLDMPDKVLVNTNHLRDNGGEFFHNMFRADRRLPKYWAYWIMRDLRGTMVTTHMLDSPTGEAPLVNQESNIRGEITSMASGSHLLRSAIPSRDRGGPVWLFPQASGIRARAAIQDNRLCILVWNDMADARRQVELSIHVPEGCQATKAQRSHVFFDSLHTRYETEHDTVSQEFKTEGERITLSFLANSDSIYAVTVDFNHLPKPTRIAWSCEYFGDQILFKTPGPSHFEDIANPSPEAFQQLSAPQMMVLTDKKQAKSARLRIAMDKPRGDWEDTTVDVNGTPYQLPVLEHVKRVALVEIPVDLADLGDGGTKLEFQPHHGEPYRVVWASVVVSNQKPSQQKAPVLVQIQDDAFGIEPGEQRNLLVQLFNKSRHPVHAKAEWELPHGWEISQNKTISIPPHGTIAWEQVLRVPEGPPQVSYEQIALILDYGHGRVTARRSYKLNAPLPCKKFAQPPEIDGRLEEWQSRVPALLQVGEQQLKVWTGWDVDNFYLATLIPQENEQTPSIPRGVEAFHVFLDLGNEKGVYNYDANDHHFWFVTPGLTTPEDAENWRLPLVTPPADAKLSEEEKQKFRWHRAYVGQRSWQGPLAKLKVPDYPFTNMQCRVTEKGYTIEASIGGAWSWSSPEQAIYGFWPKVGHVIGFDFVCDDDKLDSRAPSLYWGCGFEQLHRYYATHPREQVRGNPSAWGLLRFEN